MPFRDNSRGGSNGGHPQDPAAVDPLERFFALEAAFDADRGLLGDHVPLRLVAANLVLCPGDPDEIAAEVRRHTEQLSARLPMFSQISSPIRLLIAAVLLQREDQVEPLLAEIERVRAIMREFGMRRMEIYEVVAILALRIRNGLAPIRREQIERLRDIYAEMKRHHWLLTGPEDYPACAFLSDQPHDAAHIGARANAIYEGLRERARLWRGDPLQTASNMLALSPLEPAELVDRFVTLARGFEDADVRIGQGEYDEVAVLCFLAQPARLIVETVVDHATQIRKRLRWANRATAFGLAANLAFVRLLGNDPRLGALADAKTLLDMQTIVAARQASGLS